MKQQLLFSKFVTPLIFFRLVFRRERKKTKTYANFAYILVLILSRQGLRQAMHFTLDEKVVFV